MIQRYKRERVDLLIDHLWQQGYITLSRKYGKYLPAPPTISGYEVDSISKYKKKLAVGITISEEELNDLQFLTKLEAILNYQMRNPVNRVTLFLGVPNNSVIKATMLISSMRTEVQKHIKIVALQ
ncbi:MAG: hypothetical protein FD143_2094 [Ignavibacteria bacterium]|nr:MAG: hypothetical protein FD143_2094 [Ignavibacteria bacterium]KAF0160438.1 MAG: hypothetical protein FD188_1816 [Ignavibacteria bacterium]